MKILYMGHNQRGIRCLEALAESRHEVVMAVSQKGEKGWYESIKGTAERLGIPHVEMNNPNERKNLDQIRKVGPDLAVMCGYSKLIRKDLLKTPRRGFINLHASRLPFYRGAAPLNWALINGESEIGLSIFQVDEGIDTGDILAQETFQVGQNDNIGYVLERTLDMYPRMLLRVCDEIENNTKNPQPQNPDEGSYYTKRHSEDGVIDWGELTDSEVHNRVRALTHPYPGTFSYHRGRKVYFWGSELEPREYHGISGRVAARKEDGSVIIIAKNRGLRVKTAQIEGEEELPAKEVFKKTGLDLRPTT